MFIFNAALSLLPWMRAGLTWPIEDLPAEILQEIFLYCCGDEYIDILLLGELIYEGIELNEKGKNRHPRWANAVFILKGVCKRWKAVVEHTPQLWQRISLELDSLRERREERRTRGAPDNSQLCLQRSANQTKTVILPLSSTLPLHIRIHGTNQRSLNLKPLMDVLVEEGHRWGSLSLSSVDLNSSSSKLFQRHSNPDTSSSRVLFPKMTSLTLHRVSYYSNRLHFSTSAPNLSQLAIHGVLGRLATHCEHPVNWNHITTIVVAFQYASANISPPSTADVTRLLEACSNLAHFHWQGPLSGLSPDTPYPNVSQNIEMRQLRTLRMEDSELEVCTSILPILSCPRLVALEILVGSPDHIYHPSRHPTRMEGCQRAAAYLKSFLVTAPLLQKVTVVHSPALSWRWGRWEKWDSDKEVKYLILSGAQQKLQDRLAPSINIEYPLSDSPGTSSFSPVLLPLLQILTRLASPYIPPKLSCVPPPLTVPLSNDLDRAAHCYNKGRLSNIFDFVDHMAQRKRYEDGAFSSESDMNGSPIANIEDACKTLDCDPQDLEFLKWFMQTVVTGQTGLPGSCHITTAFVI